MVEVAARQGSSRALPRARSIGIGSMRATTPPHSSSPAAESGEHLLPEPAGRGQRCAEADYCLVAHTRSPLARAEAHRAGRRARGRDRLVATSRRPPDARPFRAHPRKLPASSRHWVQSGVQTERNRAQLRPTPTALAGRMRLHTAGSLRLGAGGRRVKSCLPIGISCTYRSTARRGIERGLHPAGGCVTRRTSRLRAAPISR